MGDDRTAMVNWVKKALSAFQDSPLTDAQCSLIDQFLQGKTIQNAAKDSGYSLSHAKRVSADISEAIALAMGELKPINKSSWLPKIRDYLRQQPESDSVDAEEPIAHPSIPNQNFVGREGAIASLNTRINQGAKITVIQASGGVGKTTLARQYFNSQGFDLVLEISIAKETENITPIENVIEECLKRDFEEEPGREFGVMLGRFKRQLQTRKVGVLIDNLEPALDGQGRLIQPHRRYLELLRILADSTVLSVTLITSRDRLCEPDITVDHYQLPGLDESAWQQFFGSLNIDIDIPTLKAMHNTYVGNAKAMGILCGAIGEDFDGNMVAYWWENSADPLVKADLNNLVTSQFQRLQELDPEAYRLLCRLGCYRYQDVPTVPTEGLLCLLWDVPQIQRRRVIESLRNRSLVECGKAEYLLHPMIRGEAIARLRAGEDWEEANRKAAAFWTDSVNTVETVEDALRALEAYYHYFEIHEFEKACIVILERRDSRWRTKLEGGEPLDGSFYRLGLFQQIISVVKEVIYKIEPGYYLIRLYDVLGISYELIGSTKKAIECAIKMKDLAQKYEFQNLKADAIKIVSRCQINLGEIEEAINNLEIAKVIYENQNLHRNVTFLYCYLAFVKTFINSEKYESEGRSLIKKSCTGLLRTDLSIWRKGFGALFLGMAYKNIGEFDNALEMYFKAIEYSEDSGYVQLKGITLYNLAELYREQSDLTTALSHHSESIALLDKIGAKCDLAEANYQLGLTHQKMGDAEKSLTPFQEAIRLFTEMEAPKQVEKVRKAIGKIDEI